MGKTDYNKANGTFSLAAHQVARERIYPNIFGEIESIMHLDGTDADLEDKIDVVVTYKKKGLKGAFKAVIQERWRRPRFSSYRDITLTSWNSKSDKLVELYVGKMEYILYGYFDDLNNRFGEVVMVNIPRLRRLVGINAISYSNPPPNNKGQYFKCFKFDDLAMTECIDWSTTPLMKNQNSIADYWRRLYMQERNNRV